MGVPEKMRRAFVDDEVSAFFTSFSWLLEMGDEEGEVGILQSKRLKESALDNQGSAIFV